MKHRLYKKRVYSLVGVTFEKFEISSSDLQEEKRAFLAQISSKEGFAFLELKSEDSPLLLCYWRGRDGTETFCLASADKDDHEAKMSDWLKEVKKRFPKLRFDTRFPKNLKEFQERIKTSFKTSP